MEQKAQFNCKNTNANKRNIGAFLKCVPKLNKLSSGLILKLSVKYNISYSRMEFLVNNSILRANAINKNEYEATK